MRTDETDCPELLLIAMAALAIAAGLELEEQSRAYELRLLAMAGCDEREARAAIREGC